jgi:hypothetical protein
MNDYKQRAGFARISKSPPETLEHNLERLLSVSLPMRALRIEALI